MFLLLGTCSSFGEELRTAGYDLTHYTIERRFTTGGEPHESNLAPVTKIAVYSSDNIVRINMDFNPAFSDYKQPSITYLERRGSNGIDTSFFFFNAPVEYADQYLTLLSTGKIKRVDGTYDATKPRGSNPKNFVATKFRVLFESKQEKTQD